METPRLRHRRRGEILIKITVKGLQVVFPSAEFIHKSFKERVANGKSQGLQGKDLLSATRTYDRESVTLTKDGTFFVTTDRGRKLSALDPETGLLIPDDSSLLAARREAMVIIWDKQYPKSP